MRGAATFAGSLLLGLIAAGGNPAITPVIADSHAMMVTSAGDAAEAVCPDDEACTLRAAIEAVNADESGGPFEIRFNAEVFPPEDPLAITLEQGPLPALTADFAQILGNDAGVIVDGGGDPELGDGIVLAGHNDAVRRLTVVGFPGGACIALVGTNGFAGGESLIDGNTVGGCETGIRLDEDGAWANNNLVGFEHDGATSAPVVTGIDALVDEAVVEDNTVANADVGINVSGSNARVSRNRITSATVGVGVASGSDTDVTFNQIGAADAPVETGVLVEARASAVAVMDNAFSHTGTAIAIAADDGETSSTGNVFRRNTYEDLDGLAIDLRADGIWNVNDPGDEDSGPNGMLNSPVFLTVAQAAITGTTCAGCTVDFYYVDHRPGGAGDHATVAIAGGHVVANGSGGFTFPTPPVAPGQWVTAIATHPGEGTSEFSESTRVGAGITQCGAVPLERGWNHAGYFGVDPLSLGSTFPPDDPGAVDLILRYAAQADAFTEWIAGAGGATLDALEPGSPYWFHATQETTVPGGLALTLPVSVPLVEGWNDFVYLGASEHPADALRSIAGAYDTVYRFVPGPTGGGWEVYAGDSLPGFANTLTEIEACGVYQVQMTASATLQPLRP